MIVLSVHNHYQQAGGEDASTALEMDLLRSYGHEVIEFREHNDRIPEMSRLRAAARTIWSPESYRSIRALIRDRRPDLVHVQNFFPLISPSAHYAARAESVPVIQTLRNFRLLCANGLFLREGSVCEDCVTRLGGPLHAVAHGCYRRDRAATTVVAAMQISHRTARTWRRTVNTFIALSEFSRRKFIEAGLPPERITVKPNFVSDYPNCPRKGPGEFALFVGRLSEEKGVRTLIEAWAGVPAFRLKIVGSGPLEGELRERVAQLRLADRVELLGMRTQPEIASLLQRTAFLVFPSICYETFGRVAVEAFASGVPVVASNLGSMAELVADQTNGLLFRPGDAGDLAKRIRWALGNPAALERFGANARKQFEMTFTPETNYRVLLGIYEATVANRAVGTTPMKTTTANSTG